MIRTATPADAATIAAIYNHYVLNTVITFEEEAVLDDEMRQRVSDTLAAGLPWFVWDEDGRVLGYAYASKWKSRCAYRYAVESSIYLDKDATGRGLGTRLYVALIDALRAKSVHAIIGGIALPNAASVALSEKLGFKKIGQFEQVGWKFEKWIDVGYWELIL
ncbi:MAG TPA: arsinothricin resistance N-acetyltransferase ArsN1 family B [Lacunisphaera sp.]|nr:arsinothricin resistance N-acetyltransferase ArsN1 family B [Lacunisphaera sp.]